MVEEIYTFCVSRWPVQCSSFLLLSLLVYFNINHHEHDHFCDRDSFNFTWSARRIPNDSDDDDDDDPNQPILSCQNKSIIGIVLSLQTIILAHLLMFVILKDVWRHFMN